MGVHPFRISLELFNWNSASFSLQVTIHLQRSVLLQCFAQPQCSAAQNGQPALGAPLTS